MIREDIRKQKEQRRPKRKRKRVWVQNWILCRESLGLSSTLMNEILTEEKDDYQNIIRMKEHKFNKLMNLVAAHI